MYTSTQRKENLQELYCIQDPQARLQHLFDRIHVPAHVEVEPDPRRRFAPSVEFSVSLDCADKQVPDLLGLLARLQDFSGISWVVAANMTQASHQALLPNQSPSLRACFFLQQGVSELLEHIISENRKRPERISGLVLDNFRLSEDF